MLKESYCGDAHQVTSPNRAKKRLLHDLVHMAWQISEDWTSPFDAGGNVSFKGGYILISF